MKALERIVEAEAHTAGRCRLCGAGIEHTFVDLGMSPLCESFRTITELIAR